MHKSMHYNIYIFYAILIMKERIVHPLRIGGQNNQ
jgi:hypothetical protein